MHRVRPRHRPASIESALARDVTWAAGEGRPRVVLLVAPCRSGTTAVSRVVGYAGTVVVYQRIKEALRTALIEEITNDGIRAYFRVSGTVQESLALPSPGRRRVLFLKETLGGAHPREASYYPLRVLIEAGWSPEELVVVTMMREPLAVFASWLKCWGGLVGDVVLATNFVAACRATAMTAVAAEQLGVQVIRFDYDSLGRHPPALVMDRLFRVAGLPTDSLASALGGWGREPHLIRGDNARFVMPGGDEHAEYLERVHDELLRSDGLRYVRKDNRTLSGIVGARLGVRERAEAEGLYGVFQEAWARTLGVEDGRERLPCVH